MALIKRIAGYCLALLIGIPIALVAVQMIAVSISQQVAAMSMTTYVGIVGGFGIVAVVIVDRLLASTVGVSPLLGIALVVSVLRGSSEDPASGRQVYSETATDRLRRMVQRNGLAIDDVMMRSDDADTAAPTLQQSTSIAVTGASGNGKSAWIKGQMTDWPEDRAIVAHALAEDGRNEMEDHLRDEMGREIIRFSSRNSTHRWDPFLDNEQTPASMQRISEMLFNAGNPPETGWTPAARDYLRAVVTIASAEFDDFAAVPEVLARDPDRIAEEIGQIPGNDILSQSVADADGQTIRSILAQNLTSILNSETFDSDLPPVSLFDFFQNPQGQAVVLNNYLADDYADAFYSFLLESAIGYAFDISTDQYFLLDEVDKLPPINNLHDLASAGRSASARGIIAFQNRSQLEYVYGNKTDTIWANCRNRVSFGCGDQETAQMVLRSLGSAEVEGRSVSESADPQQTGQSISRTVTDRLPITENRIMNLATGEALVSSPAGWWLCEMTYSGY